MNRRMADPLIRFIEPVPAEKHNRWGIELWKCGRHKEATIQFEKAVACDHSFVEAYSNLARLLIEIGRPEKAKTVIDSAIRVAPGNADLYAIRVKATPIVAEDPCLMAMERLFCQGGSLSSDEQIELNFALGKAYGDLEDWDRAFRHLVIGNGLKRQKINYDERAELRFFELLRSVFSADHMQAKRGVGDPSDLPVFILGMPRSGSTLVEQILASHRCIFGAGELTNLAMEVGSLLRSGGGPDSFPEVVTNLPDHRWAELASRYISSLKAMAPKAARIVDKMPTNFMLVGFIHLALPNARIIYTCRNALDTCLSCFSKLFKGDLPFAYDLGELGRYYRGYASMMDHWQQVLPEGVLLNVQYEDLVRDLQGQAQRIIAHCGLKWDRRCLDFHKTDRPIRTASALQVRQPIFQSSIGRWRLDRDLIKPLTDALEAKRTGLGDAQT